MDELKKCPSCNSDNLELRGGLLYADEWDYNKGKVVCSSCETEAPLEAWQGPRKRVEELEAQQKQLEHVLEQYGVE